MTRAGFTLPDRNGGWNAGNASKITGFDGIVWNRVRRDIDAILDAKELKLMYDFWF